MSEKCFKESPDFGRQHYVKFLMRLKRSWRLVDQWNIVKSIYRTRNVNGSWIRRESMKTCDTRTNFNRNSLWAICLKRFIIWYRKKLWTTRKMASRLKGLMDRCLEASNWALHYSNAYLQLLTIYINSWYKSTIIVTNPPFTSAIVLNELYIILMISLIILLNVKAMTTNYLIYSSRHCKTSLIKCLNNEHLPAGLCLSAYNFQLSVSCVRPRITINLIKLDNMFK